MSKDLNGVTPSGGEVNTLCVALEVSGSSWVVAVGGPGEPSVGMHKLEPADTGGLLEKIAKARAGAGGLSRTLLTYEAGYEGFWLARWLGARAAGLGRRRPGRDVAGPDPDGGRGGRAAASAPAGASG